MKIRMTVPLKRAVLVEADGAKWEVCSASFQPQSAEKSLSFVLAHAGERRCQLSKYFPPKEDFEAIWQNGFEIAPPEPADRALALQIAEQLVKAGHAEVVT